MANQAKAKGSRMTCENLELFEAGELYSTNREGFFSVLSRDDYKSRAFQKSYELRYLEPVVRGLNPNRNTWISQASFTERNRRAVSLRDIGLLFADLDTYHADGLRGKDPETQAELLCRYCETEGIPTPSLVLFSGRGLQAKWFLTEAIEKASLLDWNLVETALVMALEPFAADPNAKDVSRVLRVDRTVNTKSGEFCRVVYVTGGVEDCPVRYDFQDLRKILVRQNPKESRRPEPRRQATKEVQRTEARRQNIITLPDSFMFKKLNWTRLHDLMHLWEMRGGVQEGFRELSLFYALSFLVMADPGRARDLWKEAEAIAAKIAPGGDFYRRSDLSTLYRKAMAMKSGERIEYQGRNYPPVYTPRNTTLLDIFQIEPEEERFMKTIISKAEKERRRTERRRAAGEKARIRFGDVKPWELEGISRRTWYRRKEAER